jgi:hypothetical protein
MSELKNPTEEEIARLPRLAQVAFAARCARRILPLVTMDWPGVPAEHAEAVVRAVELAEVAAAGTPSDKDALATARAADRAARAAAWAARAGAQAAAMAAASAADSIWAATAAHAAVAAGAVVADAAVRADFDRLAAAAAVKKWTDGTPVPPEFFGPLWPEGTPLGWPGEDVPQPSEPIGAPEVKLPTREEIARLPRWAQVAFMARCARRVLPLFKFSWPAAPAEYVAAIARAIELAEHAKVIKVDLDVPSAVYIQDLDAAAVARAARAATVFKAPAAAAVAHAAHAAYTSAATARAAFTAAALYAAATADATAHAIQSDFDRLAASCAAEKWTDDTLVTPTFFGPMWPDGPPPGWPPEESTVDEIVLELDVPEAATDEDIIRLARGVAEHADAVYRAGGGNGLKIEEVEVYSESACPAEVRP